MKIFLSLILDFVLNCISLRTNESFLEKKFLDLTNTDEGRMTSPPTQYDFKTIFLKDR